MKRWQAIKLILDTLNDNDLALFTTGMIGREAFKLKDRSSNFYMVGSMGLVSSVGFGIAFNTKKKVIVFDGDGSLLMNVGAMGVIGAYSPKNLTHIVLDNESYQSTGEQPTISSMVDLSRVAKSLGYKKVIKVTNKQALKEHLKKIKINNGPMFMLVKVKKGQLQNTPRISHSPLRLTRRFVRNIRSV